MAGISYTPISLLMFSADQRHYPPEDGVDGDVASLKYVITANDVGNVSVQAKNGGGVVGNVATDETSQVIVKKFISYQG